MNEGLTPGRSIAIIRDLEKMLQAAPLRAALEERLRATRGPERKRTEDWAMQRVPLALFGARRYRLNCAPARVSVFRAWQRRRASSGTRTPTSFPVCCAAR